ncbi:ABC transporter substrate-binding protein [Acetobacter musti]|nr:ABC transporter substrate-binding protein [Acetobacter musti]
MSAATIRRRTFLGAAATLAMPRIARGATEPFRFLTNWFAQAEHAGFYQAQAKGYYRAEGLDVVIDHGGPQINNIQLLLAGRYDAIIGGTGEAMLCVQRNMPAVTVATTFQTSLGGILTHPDITRFSDLKGHTILLSTEVRSTLWPWLRDHYGFDDSQVRPYGYNVQPFIIDPSLAIQGFATSEPYVLQSRKIPYNYFPFSDYTVADYGNPLLSRRDVVTKRRDDVARFLHASMKGWADWMENDPGPGNALIRAENPIMTDDQIAWSRGQFRKISGFGPAGSHIGTILPDRCRAVRDFMVATHQLSGDVHWEEAFDFSFAPAMDSVFT